jgi:hypothetical protein
MEKSIRLPICILNHLQDVVCKNDAQFISDTSRWLNIPAKDIKLRIFGARGVSVPVLHETLPWSSGNPCVASECCNGLWKRCSAHAVENELCWKHRYSSSRQSYKRFDANELADLPRRTPVDYKGAIYWASENGDMVDSSGNEVSFRMNWNNTVLEEHHIAFS